MKNFIPACFLVAVAVFLGCLSCPGAGEQPGLTVEIEITKCEPASPAHPLDNKRWGVWATITKGAAAGLEKAGLRVGESVLILVHSPIMTFSLKPENLPNTVYSFTYLEKPGRTYSGDCKAEMLQKAEK